MRSILCYDMATLTGWAIRTPKGQVYSGSVQLAKKGATARLASWHTWLDTQLRTVGWWAGGVLAYEQPTLVAGRANAFRVGCHLEAVLLLAASTLEVKTILSATPGQIKKHATGKGNASKIQVIEAMRRRWQRSNLVDDNEADALALLSFVVELLSNGEVDG